MWNFLCFFSFFPRQFLCSACFFLVSGRDPNFLCFFSFSEAISYVFPVFSSSPDALLLRVSSRSGPGECPRPSAAPWRGFLAPAAVPGRGPPPHRSPRGWTGRSPRHSAVSLARPGRPRPLSPRPRTGLSRSPPRRDRALNRPLRRLSRAALTAVPAARPSPERAGISNVFSFLASRPRPLPSRLRRGSSA